MDCREIVVMMPLQYNKRRDWHPAWYQQCGRHHINNQGRLARLEFHIPHTGLHLLVTKARVHYLQHNVDYPHTGTRTHAMQVESYTR